MYKNNGRDNSKFKGCSPLQLSYNLKGLKYAVDHYSHTNCLIPKFQIVRTLP